MDQNHLSKRLQLVGQYVSKEAILADIGSDHAYLPAYLVLNKKIRYGIAGEVAKGPFTSAETLVFEHNLTGQIDVRLGDGLDVIRQDDEITDITICGMGGSLIKDILDRGYNKGTLTGNEQLILQPNVGEATLRRWLVSKSYEITNETILEENDKTYEIIIARKRPQIKKLKEEELIFGPFLIKESSPIFIKKWQHELEQLNRILKQLTLSDKDQTEKIKTMQDKINLINEVIHS